MKHTFVHNNNVKISCFDSETNSDSLPIIVIPGMVNSGDEYIESFEKIIREHRCVFITLRGRKGSDAPETGYTFYDHITDIRAVASFFTLSRFHIYGHSVGGAYALGYALQYNLYGRVFIGDYPAVYPKFPETWVQRVKLLNPIPMDKKTVQRVAEESEKINLFQQLYQLNCAPVLLHSTQPDSLIKPEHLQLYKQYRPDTIISAIHKSGHSLVNSSSEEFTENILSLATGYDS